MISRGPCGALAIAIFFLEASPLFALDPGRALTQYVQSTWRIEEGLPHNTVRAVLQTRDGYLWLGTYGGLVRFDGVRFLVYDNRNSGLRDNEVRALAEDAQGVLWVGTTAGGLHRMTRGRLEPWDQGIQHRTINALAATADGALWVGSSGGLYELRGGQVKHYDEGAGLDNLFVHALAADGRNVWLGTSDGLFRFDGRHAERVELKEVRGTDVRAVLRDREGRVWAATLKNVSAIGWDSSGGAKLQHSYELPEVWGWIYSLVQDRDGSVWVGSYGGGVYRIAGGRVARMSIEHGFLDHRPWALFEDREGSLWLGTRGGLARFRDGAATTFSKQEGLPADITRTVMEDDDGTIWIGTEGGLSSYRDGRLRNFTMRDGLPGVPVRTLLRERSGRFWVGTEAGVAELDVATGHFSHAMGRAQGLPSSAIRSLLLDRSGRVWVGTDRGVAVAEAGLGRGRMRVPPGLEDLLPQSIEALFEDREGGIWIGTINAGLRRYFQGRVENPTLLGGASIGVRAFHQDEDGTMYVGTIGTGFFVRRPGQAFQRVTTRDGLPDDAVWSILADADTLWMSSDRGVFPVSRAQLTAFLDGRAAQIVVDRVIGTRDGMKSRECNGGGQPAGVLARDGRLWYPTSSGAVAIDPKKLAQNRTPPPVVVEEVLIDRRAPAAGQDEIRAPPGSRDIEIHYTGLSLADPTRVRFRYQLEAYDATWVEAGARRIAYYARVPPGRYAFHVQAANNDGVWNETGARLALRVEPRFHETGAFRAFAVLSLLAIAGAWIRLRSLEQRAREDELQRLVATRTEELERANVQLARLATIDDLTGIANHRRFSEALEQEWQRCQRSHEPLSILLCDIDDFKAFNDRYGHPAGDACLTRVAHAIDAAAHRVSDIAARYGGEEFAAILPSTDEGGAQAVAESIRAAISALGIEHAASRVATVVTVSIGYATLRPEPAAAAGLSELIAAADRALYAAKAKGRDCCVSASNLVGSDVRSS